MIVNSRLITPRPLSRQVFEPFGDVIDTEGNNHFPINAGKCERYYDLAKIEAEGPGARVVVSILKAEPYNFPLELTMVERHPFGSQAFMPLSPAPFLIVVCHDTPAGPGTPHAFITHPGQGVNYRRNLWHVVLTPIGASQDFLVVDRGGSGNNVEEYHFRKPWEIRLPA